MIEPISGRAILATQQQTIGDAVRESLDRLSTIAYRADRTSVVDTEEAIIREVETLERLIFGNQPPKSGGDPRSTARGEGVT